ncbi:MAG TPA: transcription initiation factor IIB [Nitrososphaera sp.]|jgi:transcription initiation factor TFIIB|nr:transcription initiation factor IIB [Nitrososphaera sp.]HEX2614353.1 transcription initiation factor IIB [Nitrososphaera sp.]
MQASVVCSACRNEVVVTDHECGEVICTRCGIVIDRLESPAIQEWRAFTVDEFYSKSRAGSPTSLARYNKGMLTSIGSSSSKRNSFGASMERMRLWDFRIQAANDRGLKQALPELGHLREALGLPDPIVEKSAYFYRKASRMGLIKGRTVSSVLAASIYLACRELETPRTLNEIAAECSIPRKKVSRDYRLLVRIFDPKVPAVDHIMCITRIANKAGVSEKTKRMAIRIMREITAMQISAGKGPMGMAATVLYIACLNSGEAKTQKDLSIIAGVTEVTIRNRYSELKKHLQSFAKSSSIAIAIFMVVLQNPIIINSARHATTVFLH